MAADHFCLRWNNYQSNMVTELDTLRSEEHLVDVTLSCEGQKFRAHKVILSACSAYFRNVFKENPCDHPVVILKDVSHEDVEALLSFVYQGVVYVSEKKLASFLQTAELLQIKGLTGAASSIKENHTTGGADKGGPPPLAPTWPTRPAKSSLSPTPPKRKKGTPVRIFKQTNDGGDPGSDTNSNNGGDDGGENMVLDERERDRGGKQHHQVAITVKQECLDDNSMNVQVSLGMDDEGEGEGDCEGDSVPYLPSGSPGGAGAGGSISGNEFRDDGCDSNSGGSQAVFADMGDDDGEVKRGDEEAATLLERSLSGAGISRPFDLQGPFSSFPIPAPGQGLPDQLTPADRLGRRPCPLCPKVISNKSNLLKHMRIRHSDEYNPAACMLCNKLFKNKYSLRAHFNIYHKSVIAPPTTPGVSSNLPSSSSSVLPNCNTNCTTSS